VLLNCFAGCSKGEVIGALGLEQDDLFPPKHRPLGTPRRTAKLATPSQILQLFAHELLFLAICALTMAQGNVLTESDRLRLLACAGRFAAIDSEVQAS
jgi:hypothetical protein